MNTVPDHPPEMPMDDPLDTALLRHLGGAPEPADDGFSARVLAALPPQPPGGRTSFGECVQRARWVAMSLAGGGLALLPPDVASPDAAGRMALYALIGLLVFWSWPSRWSGA